MVLSTAAKCGIPHQDYNSSRGEILITVKIEFLVSNLGNRAWAVTKGKARLYELPPLLTALGLADLAVFEAEKLVMP